MSVRDRCAFFVCSTKGLDLFCLEYKVFTWAASLVLFLQLHMHPPYKTAVSCQRCFWTAAPHSRQEDDSTQKLFSFGFIQKIMYIIYSKPQALVILEFTLLRWIFTVTTMYSCISVCLKTHVSWTNSTTVGTVTTVAQISAQHEN